MTYRWKMLAISLTLAAPLVLGQIAVAQTLPTSSGIRVAQRQHEMHAFSDGGYTYWDALVLADFWNEGVTDAKWRAGSKLLGPVESKVYLRLVVTDARAKALANAESLRLYSDSGFTYDDAERLARYWGKENAYDGKLCIERNLILGNESVIREALALSR